MISRSAIHFKAGLRRGNYSRVVNTTGRSAIHFKAGLRRFIFYFLDCENVGVLSILRQDCDQKFFSY